jgi:predicted ATPase/class 3 adenylate cyclase
MIDPDAKPASTSASVDAPAGVLRAERPSGTVTFVFTDIEGSTQRWEADRPAMQLAVREHDRLLRAAVDEHGGYVFKTVGDALCATFARPQAAVAAMLAAQRALGAQDFSGVDGLRVRAAIHTGTADEREGDYFGPAVNRVARLLAIGHGGQVLVSATTADMLHGDLPQHASLLDLGYHRLKDLSRPEQVFQLAAPDLPEAFPPLRSLDALPNNLPRQLTSFVGRDTVLADVAALVQQSALVTLVGPGGAGKTRCAIQAGAELLDGWIDGVWLAELAKIADPSLVASVIAQVLNVQETPSRPVIDSLIPFLKRKKLLLIVDNCEHVIDAARSVVSAILQACPDVRILVTSREALNIAGEEVYRMPSLEVPATTKVTSESAAGYGAIALFTDRAVSVEKTFALTDKNAPAVAEICRRLDGIPLAIELAAARVKVLSPRQLAQKLDERFRVLTGGDRSALPRQQTMRALIDWSYDLLSAPERTLFRRLAIFAGGFTLETVNAVCIDDAVDEIAVLDLLTSLVDKSLVQVDHGIRGTTRYRLLESTREYAREKLEESGEAAALARAHAQAYLALAERLEREWLVTPSREWMARVEPELENWRAALTWALEGGSDVLLGQRLASLSAVAFVTSQAEGRRWVHVAQRTVSDQTPAELAARLDLQEAYTDWRFGQHEESYAAAQRAMARFRELGNPVFVVWATRIAGNALVLQGRAAEGEELLREALAGARAVGVDKITGWVLEALGAARCMVDDFAGARACFAEALELAAASGHWQLSATASLALAEAEFRAGDASAALRIAAEALAAYREGQDIPSIAIAQSDMAAYLVALGRYDEAFSCARETIVPLQDAQREAAVAFTLQHLAAIAALRPKDGPQQAEDDAVRAAGLLGYVDARAATLGALRENTERQEREKILIALREALGANELERRLNEGRAWSEDRAVAQAVRS